MVGEVTINLNTQRLTDLRANLLCNRYTCVKFYCLMMSVMTSLWRHPYENFTYHMKYCFDMGNCMPNFCKYIHD